MDGVEMLDLNLSLSSVSIDDFGGKKKQHQLTTLKVVVSKELMQICRSCGTEMVEIALKYPSLGHIETKEEIEKDAWLIKFKGCSLIAFSYLHCQGVFVGKGMFPQEQ